MKIMLSILILLSILLVARPIQQEVGLKCRLQPLPFKIICNVDTKGCH